MRLFPILTAAVVLVALYALIMERETVMRLVGRAPVAAAAVETAAAPEPEAALAEPAAGPIRVVAIHSKAETVPNAVLVRGRTESARSVEVRSETTGQVVGEPLRKGALVEAGEVLCRLDPGTREVSLAEARARVLEATARLVEAELALTQARGLKSEGFASETRLRGAEAGVQSAMAARQAAEAGVAAAEKEISRLTLTAPFGGLLESDTAETGSLLSAGAPCATIVQLDPVKLVGFVAETEVSRVEPGAMAGARLADGREVRGKVTYVARSADEATRTFRVEIEVGNADLSIRDGQTVEMLIAAAGTLAHLVPSSALTLDDGGRLGVRAVQDGKVTFLPVAVLRDTVDGIWVTELPADADIIVVGQEYVTEGVAVAATFRETM